MTAANMLLDAVAEAGYYALFGRSSGPQIRGGEAAAMVRVSSAPLVSVDDTTAILLAIDWQNIQRFAAELPLSPNSVIVTDPTQGEVPEAMAKSGARIITLPMKELAKTIPGGRANMVALGAVCRMIGLSLEPVIAVLGKSLKKKHAGAYDASVAALTAGAEAIRWPEDVTLSPLETAKAAAPGRRWALTGNEAAGLGLVRGGVRFCAAYPITPATEILEWLSGSLPKLGGVFVQAEDELASIAMCVGASYGGTPSATATSGPGLSLMVEALGLATASETPVVVVDVQRGGPSTGIPTKSEQSDLNIALYGMHGDAPHLVVAPNSIGDCLLSSQWAVHLAETLQTPCLVLSDQALGQTRGIIDTPPDLAFAGGRLTARTPDEEGSYNRYAVTPSGVSPMAIPGTPGGQYTADGLEHTESGTPSSQASDHAAQLDKRLRKLVGYDYGPWWAEIYGSKAPAEIAILCWGSCTGAAREAAARAALQGIHAKIIAPRLLYPARPRHMEQALAGVKQVLVVELSHLGQFHKYLRAEYDLPPTRKLNRAGPLPIRPGEILQHLIEMSP